jgi:hypothetical protein
MRMYVQAFVASWWARAKRAHGSVRAGRGALTVTAKAAAGALRPSPLTRLAILLGIAGGMLTSLLGLPSLGAGRGPGHRLSRRGRLRAVQPDLPGGGAPQHLPASPRKEDCRDDMLSHPDQGLQAPSRAQSLPIGCAAQGARPLALCNPPRLKSRPACFAPCQPTS